MNILLILQSDKISGISYYRQLMPHAHLKTLYPDVSVDQIQGASMDSLMAVGVEKLKTYNIAVLSREINGNGSGVQIINKLQELGIKVVLDVDDYWQLPSSHKLKRAYNYYGIPKLIVENIKAADYVTTTNARLADKIKEFNDKVMVLPNFADTNQANFRREDIPSPLMRFGWVGGVYHREDIEPLYRSFEKLWRDKSIKDKWQLCVGGFNVNPEYKFIEQTFTCDYKYLDYDYAQYLKEYSPVSHHIMNQQPYKRLWARDVFDYVQMYNELDVALVPLRDSEFNNCKSELKVIEAAAMGKAVIVSDVYPYNQICNSSNSILIGKDKPHLEWYQAIKYFIKNKSIAKLLALKLQDDCNQKFNANNITNERKQLYQWIIK